MSFTTQDLIRQVRNQTQEANTTTVSDAAIIDALNRGQDYGFDMMAKHYSAPLAQEVVDVTADSNGEIDISETSFEDRLAKIEAYNGGRYYDLTALSFTDISKVDNTTLTGAPRYYSIIGRKIRVLPNPQNSYTFRLWYLREIEQLELSQGRITGLGTVAGGESNAYITLDALGSSLSSTDDYGKFVNVVDAQTGEIKCSMEIASINTSTKQVKFKITASRSSVLNKTISTDLASTVQVDDYVCAIDGTCVPYFKKPLTNFLVQYAVVEIRRSLGYDISMEERKLQKLEQQVERTWAGRQNTKRIQPSNNIWKRRPFIR